MAPTMITRSIARQNGVVFHCLNAGVQKAVRCITCNNRHGSRAARSHCKSHSIRYDEVALFAPPTCWDEEPFMSYPPTKQEIRKSTIVSDVFNVLPSNKPRTINTKLKFALAGVKNKKKVRDKEDQTRLRLLHWWFGANEWSLKARTEFGREGLFLREGERELQDHGQKFDVNGSTAEDDSLIGLVNSPPSKQAEPLSTANAPTPQADDLFSDPDQAAYTASAETGFFDHDFDRSLKGSVIADFELASTRPLTSLPLLWCMSNTFTHFVKTRGEDLISVVALKRATEAHLEEIGVSQDLVDKLNSRFDYRIMSKYENVDLCAKEEDKQATRLGNARRFRKDRAFVWDVLEQAMNDYFNDYDNFELPVALAARRSCGAVKVVVKATWTFVRLLDDTQTSAYLRKYWNGKI